MPACATLPKNGNVNSSGPSTNKSRALMPDSVYLWIPKPSTKPSDLTFVVNLVFDYSELHCKTFNQDPEHGWGSIHRSCDGRDTLCLGQQICVSLGLGFGFSTSGSAVGLIYRYSISVWVFVGSGVCVASFATKAQSTPRVVSTLSTLQEVVSVENDTLKP